MVKEYPQCCERVHVPQSFHSKQCSRLGRYEEDGKNYCKVHAPSERRKRNEESSRQFHEEREKRAAKHRLPGELREEIKRLKASIKELSEENVRLCRELGK